jgi:hypothetical protein
MESVAPCCVYTIRNSYPHRQPESNIHEICVNVVLLQEQQHIDYLTV